MASRGLNARVRPNLTSSATPQWGSRTCCRRLPPLGGSGLLFFVSSLFVKKPTRIQGLLMVMTLALLVYSVAQRRLRQELVRQKESLPNQINQLTQRPTLRWVFQLLEGIHRVRVSVQGQMHDLIEGLNEVQIKILRLFGQEVCQIYQISSA